MATNNIGAIIFSRFDSSRLYGKALIDIEGRCLLGRVIDRAKLIKDISKIIGKDFIKKSLETKNIHIARQKRDEILYELEKIALNKHDEDENNIKMHDSSNIYNDPIESKPEKEQEFSNSEKIFSSNHKKYSIFSFRIPKKEDLIVNIDKYIPISIVILTLIVAFVA